MDPLLGIVIDDRYQIEGHLGAGGLGCVYVARHTRLSRRFAIKVLAPHHAADPELRERFAREAELAGGLSHPNVIGVVDTGETADGLPYLAMELADGESLRALVTRGPVARDRAIAIVAQIAAGLDHAHAHGVVHRDLKPDNLLVDRDGAVRIIDFGIASRDAETRPARRLTMTGTTIGTPQYMAPEQAYGEIVDGRADLFALGLILYELIAGHAPFTGTPLEVMYQNTTEPPPRTGADALLEALAFWLLEKRADDRPADAATVVRVLGWIQHDPELARVRLAPWIRPVSQRRPCVRMTALR